MVEAALLTAIGNGVLTVGQECQSMNGDAMHNYQATGLLTNDWDILSGITVQDAQTAYAGQGGVGTVVVFDVNQIEIESICAGGAIYVDGQEYTRTGEMTNQKPSFMRGDAVVFWMNGAWWRQLGENGNPEEVSYTCQAGAGCDNAELEAAEDRIASLEQDLQQCQANGGGGACTDNMREPILVHNEWWFCDELIPADCEDGAHGQAVTNHCPGLCGGCTGFSVCDEAYHTKVLLPGVGSVYCDQLYPEECNQPGVSETCCAFCT